MRIFVEINFAAVYGYSVSRLPSEIWKRCGGILIDQIRNFSVSDSRARKLGDDVTAVVSDQRRSLSVSRCNPEILKRLDCICVLQYFLIYYRI